MLLENLAKHPDATAHTLTAAYHLGLRHNTNMAVDAISHPNAPTTILDDAAQQTDPKLRIAWLSRPERTEAEIATILKKERRGDVLAALVPHALNDPAILNALAASHKRPVALTIMSYDPDGLSDDAVDELLRTIDPQMHKLNYSHSTIARTFYDNHPDAVVRNASTLTSNHAHHVISRNPDTPAEVLATVVQHAVADTNPNYWKHGDWQALNNRRILFTNITNHPNITHELLNQLSDRLGQTLNNKERDQIEQARERIRTGTRHATNTDTVATSDDVNVIQNIFHHTNKDTQHRDLVKALMRNPNLPTFLRELSSYVYRALTGSQNDTIAKQIVTNFGDQTLADILTTGHRTDKLEAVAAAHNPEAVRRHVVHHRLKLRNLQLEEAINNNLIDAATIGTVPSSTIVYLNSHSQPQTVTLTEHHLAQRLGSNVDSWQMFLNLLPKYPGTIDELIATTLASTTWALS